MDDIDCAAERVEAFTSVALHAVLHRLDGPSSTGICQECGAVIEARRLAANPHAQHCHDCAEDLERERRRARLCGPR